MESQLRTCCPLPPTFLDLPTPEYSNSLATTFRGDTERPRALPEPDLPLRHVRPERLRHPDRDAERGVLRRPRDHARLCRVHPHLLRPRRGDVQDIRHPAQRPGGARTRASGQRESSAIFSEDGSSSQCGLENDKAPGTRTIPGAPAASNSARLRRRTGVPTSCRPCHPCRRPSRVRRSPSPAASRPPSPR